jgi:hypothetical protein
MWTPDQKRFNSTRRSGGGIRQYIPVAQEIHDIEVEATKKNENLWQSLKKSEVGPQNMESTPVSWQAILQDLLRAFQRALCRCPETSDVSSFAG